MIGTFTFFRMLLSCSASTSCLIGIIKTLCGKFVHIYTGNQTNIYNYMTIVVESEIQ